MDTIYDVMILGAGPAGLTAALYAGRSGLNTLLLEQGQDGGQIALTDEIENYPGQLEGESGAALIARMSAQAERFGAVRARDVIRSAELTGTVKTLTGLQNAYRAHAVILASGATPRPIGCKNEEQYVGRGISYCATCDAGFFQNKAVYVAGSSSIAVEEALYLTGFAREVTLLCGRERLSAPKALQERAFAQPKLHILWNTAVAEVGGSGSAVLDRGREMIQMLFEWDDNKEKINIAKHSIDFSTAAHVFQDENRIEFFDEAHSEYEDRYITIGQINGIAIIVMVVYTERENAIRLISARKATNQERRMYYDCP